MNYETRSPWSGLYLVALLCVVFAGFGCANTVNRDFRGGLEVVTVRTHYNNVHAIVFDEGLVLVDAGLAEDAPAVDAALRKAGLDPERIIAVVLTHGHADHAGGAAWFRARYGAVIVAGAEDAPMLARGHNDRLCPTDATARRRLEKSQAASYEPFEADDLVTHAVDLREALGVPLRIVPLPGHTAGSLIVLAEDSAFVGDLFRGEIAGNKAAVHFYMCDLEANRADIGWLLHEGAPAATTFYPGHFGPVARDAVADGFGTSPTPSR